MKSPHSAPECTHARLAVEYSVYDAYMGSYQFVCACRHCEVRIVLHESLLLSDLKLVS